MVGALNGLSLPGLAPQLSSAPAGPPTAASDTSTCRSYGASETCETTNRYLDVASAPIPGSSRSMTVTLANVAQGADRSATLTPGACTTTSTGAVSASVRYAGADLCSALRVEMYAGTTASGRALYDGPLSDFTSDIALGRTTADSSQSYTFVMTVSGSGAPLAGGLAVVQPMTWTFS